VRRARTNGQRLSGRPRLDTNAERRPGAAERVVQRSVGDGLRLGHQCRIGFRGLSDGYGQVPAVRDGFHEVPADGEPAGGLAPGREERAGQ
jgi:hypothetical protein